MANEFENDLRIDPEQLDVEAIEQAEKFFRYAEEAIKARGIMDRAKLHMDIVESDILIKVRENPEKYGLDKVTVATVEAAAQCNNDTVKAHKEYLAAKETYLILDAATDAMEQRKRMIELMVNLQGQKYFAAPAAPREIGKINKERKRERRRRRRKKQEDDNYA